MRWPWQPQLYDWTEDKKRWAEEDLAIAADMKRRGYYNATYSRQGTLICGRCGGLILNPDVHDDFHARVDPLDMTS